jgi:hypothetical protein
MKISGKSFETRIGANQRAAGPNYLVLVGLALPRRPNFNPPSVTLVF